MSRARRGLVAAAAVALVAAALTQIAPSSATWVDPLTFSAPIDAGTWNVTPPPTDPDINDGGITAGNEHTEISDIVWSDVQPQSICTTVEVTGTSSNPEPWQVDIDLTQVPFRGVPPYGISFREGVGSPQTVQGTTMTLTGKGNSAGGFDPKNANTPITNAQTATLVFCIDYAPSPQGDPGWYDIDVTELTDDWTPGDACVQVTATTTQTNLVENPFFYGWTATLDMTNALAYIQSFGGAADRVLFTPEATGPGVLETTPQPWQLSSTYELKSGHSLAIRADGSGRESATVIACAHDDQYVPPAG